MILHWTKGDFTRSDQMLGVIFDAGMIKRSDLAWLLNWKIRMLSRYVRKARDSSKDFIRKLTLPTGECAYALGEDGVRYMHQMLGIQSKVVTMAAQMNHTLGLNNILMRYLRKHGRERIQWLSTREASDELFRLRSMAGDSDELIRQTMIRPDALFASTKGRCWIEYDNNTEGSRQIFNKYRLYLSNLEQVSPAYRRVVWVTKTEARRKVLQQRWTFFEQQQNHQLQSPLIMEFYVEGSEFLIRD